MTKFYKVLVVFTGLSLAGCVVHRVETNASLDNKIESLGERLAADPHAGVALTPLNIYPEGAHCFEPLFYVLSLGLIPTHCVSRFHVSDAPIEAVDVSTLETDVTVTSMQGWLPVFLGALPDWQFGYGEGVEDEVRELIESGRDSSKE